MYASYDFKKLQGKVDVSFSLLVLNTVSKQDNVNVTISSCNMLVVHTSFTLNINVKMQHIIVTVSLITLCDVMVITKTHSLYHSL